MQSTTMPAPSSTYSRIPAWRLLGSPNVSLMEALLPNITLMQKSMVAALFIVLTIGLAQARFYLPDNPIPITFQTFGILLMGGVLGWRWGLVSVVGYYLLGMAGVPAFQGGNGGWQYVQGVTGGYLLGFLLATLVVGLLASAGWDRSMPLAAAAMLIGNIIIYIPGLLWLGKVLGWENPILQWGLTPFIFGDIAKLVLATLLLPAAWRLVRKS